MEEAGTDSADGDSTDADGTDADGTDADGTDADGTDGDSTDVSDGDSTDASSGEAFQQNRCFGIQRDTQCAGVCICFLVDCMKLFKDGIRFRDFL